MLGKNNPRYVEKEHLICDNCGKEFERIPSTSSIPNKDGDIHNFCCQQCYWDFRSKYYIGDKLYNTGKKMNEEFCDKIRKATLLQYKEGIFDRQTKPQKIVNEILEQLHISYINEETFKYYSVDNYLNNHNLIIEVMGDYFHSNPNKYPNYKQLNDIQLKDTVRDKRKNTYIKKYYNINILYLWESDILNNQQLCKSLILYYIKNNGLLSDYNSFNYSLIDNKVTLKSNIINPYFMITP